jgi:hypothetical protein
MAARLQLCFCCQMLGILTPSCSHKVLAGGHVSENAAKNKDRAAAALTSTAKNERCMMPPQHESCRDPHEDAPLLCYRKHTDF